MMQCNNTAMFLKNLQLENFRNHTKLELSFSTGTTIIVGPNAIGKSNLIEAVFIISTGKSSRSDKQAQVVQLGKNICRVKGKISEASGDGGEEMELEVVFAKSSSDFLQRKYIINGVSKRRLDFSGRIPVVGFSPLDLDIVAGAPGVRRRFLDEGIEAIDNEYRHAQLEYSKALRQRNALLQEARDSGVRSEERFLYWDGLLIKSGGVITGKREEYIEYINSRKKEFFDFDLTYDKSEISRARLDKYKGAEVGAGVTLVGPHRDDFIVKARNRQSGEEEEVRYFSSRGQQRLVALELKLSQIALIDDRLDTRPILLLDDVFSELDESNINRVLDLMNIYQTIATTTHKEFVGKQKLQEVKMIELDNKVKS
jgi:DNA replication and repair protein RecF